MFLGDAITYMGADDPTAGVTYPDLSQQPLPTTPVSTLDVQPYDPNLDPTGTVDLNATALPITTTGIAPAPAPVVVGATMQSTYGPFAYVAIAAVLYLMTKRGGSRIW